MRNYREGKIYKIECNLTPEVYYGSTTKSLSHRMWTHKNRRRCSSKQIIDRGNYTVKIVEYYPCDSKIELEARERWWIENNVCINKRIPTRTKIQFYADNIELMRERNKNYNKNNKEKIQAQKKIYRENNKQKIANQQKEKIQCECGCIVTKRTLDRHKLTTKHLKLINNKAT